MLLVVGDDAGGVSGQGSCLLRMVTISTVCLCVDLPPSFKYLHILICSVLYV